MLLKPAKTRTRNRQSEVRRWEETQETPTKPWETMWVSVGTASPAAGAPCGLTKYLVQ